MPSSRYARLNPFGNAQQTASPVAEEPLQFSNVIPDAADHTSPSSHLGDEALNKSSRKSLFRAKDRKASSTTDALPYTGFDTNIDSRPPKRQRTSSSFYRAASSFRDYAVSHFTVPAVAAPWEHELSEKHGAGVSPSDSIRYFDYRRQRRRLFINSTFQWFITAFICAALAGCLYGFSTLIFGLTSTQKYVFNALITGLSICLGLNLASSLKGYAQMMRWRFLASGYRTIQDFELVMNCDSQSKVFRLIWAGRTRGRRLPNKTQILAVVWIIVNVALQVFTALLGLTYSTDVSSEYVRLTYGNVSVADVSYVGTSGTSEQYAGNYTSPAALLAELPVANAYGVTGQDFWVYDTTFDQYFANEQSIYTDNNFFWYRFIDRSPLSFALTTASLRTVNTTAKCQLHKVTSGGYAGFNTDNTTTWSWVTWIDNNGDENTWAITAQATGATTWMSNITSQCGPRCAQIYALQVADNTTVDANSTDDVPFPRFWSCSANVSHVDNTDQYINPKQYDFPDITASILAGAIGWSGVVQADANGNLSFSTPEEQLQMVSYPVDSQWSPSNDYTADDMAWLIMKFTAGAISAMDSVGPRLNVTGYGPAPAQIINVQWRFSAAILGGIPFAQGLILLAVIISAHKAIIKDTSHLSTARLLRPIVEKLGNNGCLLTGDEIAEHLGNFRVIYGVREPNVGLGGGMGVGVIGGEDGKVRHLDILDEAEGLGYRKGRMPEGRYDGLYPVEEEEKQALLADDAESDSNDDRQASWTGPPRRKRATRRMSI
ncbi:hypothetical protein H2200_008867 [Cladophialophora chaetospira]|uniref:Uncharacterized protein n=1 Tax=Cladophialophora chaetospira TaxID=386627 RepID=A0AA38X4U1_9EURO|nr:hypothetical protein H2200_008867 [Cladophialophora chaetospira]